MKKARARSATKQALPPPLPALEDLEARAAAEVPSVDAAWWITHQVVQHALAVTGVDDARTGEPLAMPVTDLLARIRRATSRGCRPFPHDRVARAAELTRAPLTHLLDHHRHRIVRDHAQLPFHQLREVDARAMAWLARQPGRTVREKLAGRTHALGVQRDVSADTTENRLLVSFARLLARRASARLELRRAYDASEDDDARVADLEACVRLCDDKLRRSELADVPTLVRLQPNNVLLNDPLYARIFRAWKSLRDDEEALRAMWPNSLHHARALLCWMVAAELAAHERIVLAETLGRVRSEVGIERLGTAAWELDPPLHFLVLPVGREDAVYRIRLSLEGDFLLSHVASLIGRGVLREDSFTALSFEIKAMPHRLAARRGFGIAVESATASMRDADETYADLAGLTPLAARMARQILRMCDLDLPARTEVPKPGIADGARLGIELGHTALHTTAERAISLTTAPWALACELPGDAAQVEWIDGRGDRALRLGADDRALWTMGDAFEVDAQRDPGMLALATQRIVGALAAELRAPASARLAYTVPDAVDELSQRSLRAAFGAAFDRPVPVWRSVAAAIAWASSPAGRALRSGDSVAIVDTELAGVSITVLTARHDARLARLHPASRGLYWERKPPLPPDDRLAFLGWPHLLRAYARRLVGELSVASADRLVDDLIASGEIARLVRRGGSIFAQLPEVVELVEDPAWLDRAIGQWARRLDDVLRELRDLHVVLVGGPCAYERFFARATGRLKWMPQRMAISPPQLADAARACLLRRDTDCETWREWLPELSLEVVRDGHFGELPLLREGTYVKAFLGEASPFTAPDTLTLAPGPRWYSFPLLVGRQGRRPLAWEARLESPAFPLDHPVRVRLTLAYRYGFDNSYELSVAPESPADAPFSRLEAVWTEGGAHASAPPAHDALVFMAEAWLPRDATSFANAARSVNALDEGRFGKFLFAVTRACWSHGRSVATAPPAVQQAFPTFRDRLVQMWPQVPQALDVLTLLHEDAPAEVVTRVLELDDQAGDDPASYRKVAVMIARLVGDATHERAMLLHRLLDRLQRHTDVDHFAPALTGATIRALGAAAWRHPGFIPTLAAKPHAVPQLLDHCGRSLQNLLARVPLELDSDEHRDQVTRRYGTPFRDACELLLALLRIDPSAPAVAPLHRGSRSAYTFAKAIRQLDARFAAATIDLRWRIGVQAVVPDSLHRMSPAAFALNRFLTDGGGGNFVHISTTNLDDQ